MIICVFCDTIYPEPTLICKECNDYKGMMPMTKEND